jgi:hypothetical protein
MDKNSFEIYEQHVFKFVFPFMGDVATFNVVAKTQQEAAEKIMDWMSKTMVELSMVFPKTMVEEVKEKAVKKENLAIRSLIEDLSKWLAPVRNLEDAAIIDSPRTVKEWLKMDYEEGNFPAIIEELEKLKVMYETGKIKKAGR